MIFIAKSELIFICLMELCTVLVVDLFNIYSFKIVVYSF